MDKDEEAAGEAVDRRAFLTTAGWHGAGPGVGDGGWRAWWRNWFSWLR